MTLTVVQDTSTDASGYVWLALYFLSNLTLTIYNKAAMQFVGFNFPWMLTGLHTFCSAVGCFLAVYGFKSFRVAHLSMKENMIMVAFSFLYTINIAISNISLNMVTVPFHQVVRATTPVFTIIMNVLFLQKHYSFSIYLSLVPVIMGVVLATFGEYNYTQLGLFLTLLGTFLAALKTIITNVVQVGKLKLHPMDLLLRMSPLAFLQCLFYANVSGELEEMKLWVAKEMTTQSFLILLCNGMIAFFLNVISFTANKKTSALTMTIAANVKQVLSIVLAVVIFNLTITSTNAAGILMTVIGGAWYTWLEMKEKQKMVMVLPIQKTNALSIKVHDLESKE